MTTIITGSTWRISFLTSRLVRLEYQKDGRFEDRPTTMARNREFPAVEVQQVRGRHGLELDTEYLHLIYDEKPFSASGLSIWGKTSDYNFQWHFGDPLRSLGGTARTLDGVDGETEVGPGLVSRAGWSVVDDSTSMILTEDGRFLPRGDAGTDLYFFGYGQDYTGCLKDYFALSGEVPMLPRYALGNWWSRYHVYTEESYLQLMDRFEKAGIPLSVAVIDMDWHVIRNPWHSGWTGYSWNRELFPCPERFLRRLHEKGMRVTLNVHPAQGVAPHEDAYPDFCRAVGMDPEQQKTAYFDVADETFMKAYFSVLHHPMEKEGVDFWWIDWQQGTVSAVEGLDPLWALNEMHYRDHQRKGQRGLILSRYAGPGSHRCPVGFSGDSYMTWASLEFQPRFTAMASNIGYPWWSHDIGGHMGGIRSDELTVRWLQLGVFSPILRLHSSNAEFISKEPWSFGRETETVMGEWLRFRHRLIPYLYTAAERTHRLGEPLVRPMYYQWPGERTAYSVPNQFLFGQSLMVCPITRPKETEVNLASVEAWLPEGCWFDIFTGQIYTGNRKLTLWREVDEYPVLAPEGAILPLSDSLGADMNPDSLTLRVFAGRSGEYTLYEDDGIHTDSPSVRTRIVLDWEERTLSVAAEGELSLLPEKRIWNIECIGFAPAAVFRGTEALSASYDRERNAICFRLETDASGETAAVRFSEARLASDDWRARVRHRLLRCQSSNDEKQRLWNLLGKGKRHSSLAGTVSALCSTPNLESCLMETVFAQGFGEDGVPDASGAGCPDHE